MVLTKAKFWAVVGFVGTATVIIMEKMIYDDTVFSEIELFDVEYASYMATFGKSYGNH